MPYFDSDSSSDSSIPDTMPVNPASSSIPVLEVPRPPIRMKRTGQEGMPKFDDDFFIQPPAPNPPVPEPPTPVSASDPAPGFKDDAQIKLITSDVVTTNVFIQPPREPNETAEDTPTRTPTPTLTSSARSRESLSGSRKRPSEVNPPKKSMSYAHRQAISQKLKERWANGRMSHVHDKIRENNKRKSLASGEGETAQTQPKKQRENSAPVTLSEPQSLGSADGEESLWEYIQQYLVHHRGGPLPRDPKIPELLKLKKRRDIEWNAHRPLAYVDSHARSITALIIQIVGDLAPDPCYRCKDRRGPFKGCVKLAVGSGFRFSHCANCMYGHQVCRQELWVGKKKPSASGQQDGRDLEAEDDEYSDLEDDSGRNDDPTEMDTVELIENPGSKLDVVPIRECPSGRAYDVWIDENGNRLPQYLNLLLPDGYKPNHDDPGRPWKCPVVDCGGAYPRLQDLRCHFARRHYAAMMNDNLDGTLTTLGHYDPNRELGNGGSFPCFPPSLAVVVSQNRRYGSGKAPKASPHSRTTRSSESVDVEADPLPMSEATILQTMTPADARNARAMWDYILPHLHSTKTIPTTGHVKELLPLPRIRDLKWNPNRAQDFIEKVPRDISCMIIQVTGEEAPTPCAHCVNGKNPFDGCVVIARHANPEVRSRMISCANCNYHGLQTRCNIKQWVQEREQPEYTPFFNPKAKKAYHKKEEDTVKPSQVTPSVSDRPQTAGRVVAESTRSLRPRTRPADTTGAAALITPGQVPPSDEALDMEEWEIAPGRIRSQASEAPDNIAMSHAYLASSQPIQVCNDLSLRLADIRGGTTMRFDVEQDKTRICTIANGKLKVKIESEPEFVVGPRGMFKIRPGASCSALNMSYSWAAMFITAQTEYD